MVDTGDMVHHLTATAETIRALVQGLSDEQTQWRPSSETWSIKQVMEHVYNEERMDFRQRLEEMLSDPPQPWGAFRGEYVSVASCRQALDGFLIERKASLAWLETLESPDWDIKSQATFGPLDETIILSAGDVLVSWVDHDLLHLHQMITKLHAWHEQEVAPYSTQYAGGQW